MKTLKSMENSENEQEKEKTIDSSEKQESHSNLVVIGDHLDDLKSGEGTTKSKKQMKLDKKVIQEEMSASMSSAELLNETAHLADTEIEKEEQRRYETGPSELGHLDTAQMLSNGQTLKSPKSPSSDKDTHNLEVQNIYKASQFNSMDNQSPRRILMSKPGDVAKNIQKSYMSSSMQSSNEYGIHKATLDKQVKDGLITSSQQKLIEASLLDDDPMIIKKSRQSKKQASMLAKNSNKHSPDKVKETKDIIRPWDENDEVKMHKTTNRSVNKFQDKQSQRSKDSRFVKYNSSVDS